MISMRCDEIVESDERTNDNRQRADFVFNCVDTGKNQFRMTRSWRGVENIKILMRNFRL